MLQFKEEIADYEKKNQLLLKNANHWKLIANLHIKMKDNAKTVINKIAWVFSKKNKQQVKK